MVAYLVTLKKKFHRLTHFYLQQMVGFFLCIRTVNWQKNIQYINKKLVPFSKLIVYFCLYPSTKKWTRHYFSKLHDKIHQAGCRGLSLRTCWCCWLQEVLNRDFLLDCCIQLPLPFCKRTIYHYLNLKNKKPNIQIR